jgi:hypothetical protein
MRSAIYIMYDGLFGGLLWSVYSGCISGALWSYCGVEDRIVKISLTSFGGQTILLNLRVLVSATADM